MFISRFKLPLIVAALATVLPASAAVTVFTTTLGAAGEPVPTSTATGTATVVFNDATNSIAINLVWTGLLGTGPFGHIHCCTAVAGTGNSPVSQGFAALTNAASGSYNDVFNNAPNFATILAGAQAGKAYVNIHTPGTYAAGEIRGFLALSTVPEPGSIALTLAALGLAAAVTHKRRAPKV